MMTVYEEKFAGFVAMLMETLMMTWLHLEIYRYVKHAIPFPFECLYKQPKSERICFSDKQAKQSRVPKQFVTE